MIILKFFSYLNNYSPQARRGEYSPIFTEPGVNNCFGIIITQEIIREKQEPFEKCRFCLFVCLFQIVTRQ